MKRRFDFEFFFITLLLLVVFVGVVFLATTAVLFTKSLFDGGDIFMEPGEDIELMNECLRDAEKIIVDFVLTDIKAYMPGFEGNRSTASLVSREETVSIGCELFAHRAVERHLSDKD